MKLGGKHEHIIRQIFHLKIKYNCNRHPLQELCISPFIPNNVKLNVEGHPKGILLTGANGSGKVVSCFFIYFIAYQLRNLVYWSAEIAFSWLHNWSRRKEFYNKRIYKALQLSPLYSSGIFTVNFSQADWLAGDSGPNRQVVE